MNSDIDPAVLLHPERPNPTYPSHTAMSGRLAGDQDASARSAAPGISAFDLQGSTVVLTLSEGVNDVVAKDPKNYLVTVNGASYMLPKGAVSYDSATRRVRLHGIPFRQRDHIGVTVLGMWDRIKNIPGPSVSCIVDVPAWPHMRSLVLIFLAMGAVLLAIIVALFL